MSSAAEEELTLLSITGDLIGRIENLDADAGPEFIVSTYYAELPQETRLTLRALQARLDRRMADYAVAVAAADTAEINEIQDDLGLYWTTIVTAHEEEFTPEVVETLRVAYGVIYRFIRDGL